MNISEEEDKTMLLLCSLTPEYETFVTSLLANKEKITLQSASNSLLGHHNYHSTMVVVSLKAMGCMKASTRVMEDKRTKKSREIVGRRRQSVISARKQGIIRETVK